MIDTSILNDLNENNFFEQLDTFWDTLNNDLMEEGDDEKLDSAVDKIAEVINAAATDEDRAIALSDLYNWLYRKIRQETIRSETNGGNEVGTDVDTGSVSEDSVNESVDNQ